MELHNLKPKAGATKSKKRIARGVGAGTGRTATRGHKGQKSRSGFKNKRNFEGGQMPLQMRLPKRGFKNPNRIEYKAINLTQLEAWTEKYNMTSFDLNFFKTNRIIKKNDLIKILGNGEVSKSITVEAHAASAKAKEAIESKGGSIQVV